jgi:hypothetical protein
VKKIKNQNNNLTTTSKLKIFTRLSPIKTTEVYDTYWKFAAARQEVFFSRINGSQYPWTTDPIIKKYKFTNVYRATDRVSQYLIKNVIYKNGLSKEPDEILFRILLFKLFNKIETWELLIANLGDLSWQTYSFKHYDKVLSNAIMSGRRIYSAAYIMPSGQSYFGYERKHSNHLKLIELMINSDTHERLMTAKRMQDAFEIIKGFPGLGDFLAYQLLIDINYSSILNFSESEFVVPGPGAKGGISKCFVDLGGLSLVEIIKFMTDQQEEEFERLGLNFKTLWGRKLQLIDCQNIFCEVDKYSRVKHPQIKGMSERSKIKQMFRANLKPIDLWFPPKWGINDEINTFKPKDGNIKIKNG